MFKKCLHLVLFSAVFVIPTQKKDQWEVLSYSKISANKISFSEKGINVKVRSSASPLIYPFSKPKSFKKLTVKGVLPGELNVPAGKQGTKGFDDFVLRIGLVIEGDKKLNFFQRSIAANWVKRLYSLASKGMGVDRIVFYNVQDPKGAAFKERTHPLTDLIEERIMWTSKKGEFLFEVNELPQEKILALWISIDGDDTKSEFEVLIEGLKFAID